MPAVWASMTAPLTTCRRWCKALVNWMAGQSARVSGKTLEYLRQASTICKGWVSGLRLGARASASVCMYNPIGAYSSPYFHNLNTKKEQVKSVIFKRSDSCVTMWAKSRNNALDFYNFFV